jgi:hypothetical protein
LELQEFDSWLSGVARLNLAQRRRALSALLDLDIEPAGAVEVAPAEAGGRLDIASPHTKPVGTRTAEEFGPSEAQTVAAIVHRRVEVSGCPHCASSAIAA